MVYYDLALDMKDHTIIKTGLMLCSGDSGLIQFNIKLLNGSVEYTGEFVKKQMIFLKQNGVCITGDLQGTAQPFTYVVQGSELDTPGPVICDVKVYEAEGRISSRRFAFIVLDDTKRLPEEDAHEYQSELDALIAECEEKLESLQTTIAEEAVGAAELLQDKLDQLENQFNTWFDGVKSDLSGDVAGNLQNQINTLKEQMENALYAADEDDSIQ